MDNNARPVTKFCACGAFIGVIDADGRVLMGSQWLIYSNSVCAHCGKLLVWRSGEWRRARMEKRECVDVARVLT